MLVIRRKSGESLVIGNRIRVTILETRGGTVKIGIEAPAELSVLRQEIVDGVEAANRAATEEAPDSSLLSKLPKGSPREEPEQG